MAAAEKATLARIAKSGLGVLTPVRGLQILEGLMSRPLMHPVVAYLSNGSRLCKSVLIIEAHAQWHLLLLLAALPLV